jgi:tRNA dimethylallyltransferase
MPLLVGGTMLYFKALTDGLTRCRKPTRTSAPRSTRARPSGWPALHRELRGVDPATAARLDPYDRQRIQRALEVFALTGRPLSAFSERSAARARHVGCSSVALVPRTARCCISGSPSASTGCCGGLVDEVRALRRRTR